MTTTTNNNAPRETVQSLAKAQRLTALCHHIISFTKDYKRASSASELSAVTISMDADDIIGYEWTSIFYHADALMLCRATQMEAGQDTDFIDEYINILANESASEDLSEIHILECGASDLWDHYIELWLEECEMKYDGTAQDIKIVHAITQALLEKGKLSGGQAKRIAAKAAKA